MSTSYPVNFSGVFGNALYDNNVYTFPTGAESWGGFAIPNNIKANFPDTTIGDDNYISFDYSTDTDVTIKFKFEYKGFPNTEPSFYTADISLTAGSGSKNISLSTQGANTFNSFLLFIVDRDIPVTLTNIVYNLPTGSGPVQISLPTSAPDTPPVRNPEDVVSIYSDAYTNLSGTNFNPTWGQSTDVSINVSDSNVTNIIQYTNFNFQGTELNGSYDLSNMEFFHFDIYTTTTDKTNIKFSPINDNSNNGSNLEHNIQRTITPNQWNSIDVSKSEFIGMTWDGVFQLRLGDGNDPLSTTFIDNIYFYKESSAQPLTFANKSWTYETTSGDETWFANNELQGYDSTHAVVNNDILEISLTKETGINGNNVYKSSRIFTYSDISDNGTQPLVLEKGGQLTVEFEAKMPKAFDNLGQPMENVPLWPALWMMGSGLWNDSINQAWPYCGEVDVMEWSPLKGNTNYSSAIHYNNGIALNHGYDATDFNTGNNLTDNYHRYKTTIIHPVDSNTPATIEMYFDDNNFHTFTLNDEKYNELYQTVNNSGVIISDSKSYGLIMNIALGGSYTGYNGTFEQDFPTFNNSIMYVKSINISQGPVLPLAICFPAGTPVTTDQGNIPIEKIKSHIHTIRGKSIVAITQTRLLNKDIVSIEKDALVKNVPSQTTHISNNHKVFFEGQMVKAKELVDVCEHVNFIPYNGETLYNVLLKKDGKMMINNLICETLSPTNVIAMILKTSDKTEMKKKIRKLTSIINKNDVVEYKKFYASLK